MNANVCNRLAGLALIAALLVATLGAAARPAAARPLAAPVPPVHDVYVDPNDPDLNFNTCDQQNGFGWLEDTYSNFPGFVPTRRSYLRFPVGSIVGATGRSLLVVTVVSNNLPPGSSLNLAAYGVSQDNWDEATLTYNQAAGFTTTLLQTVTINSGVTGPVVFGSTTVDNPVGAYIEQERQGDGLASFLLKFTGGSGDLGIGGTLLFDDRTGCWDGINGNEPYIDPRGPTAVGLSETSVRTAAAGPDVLLPVAIALALGGCGLLLLRRRAA